MVIKPKRHWFDINFNELWKYRDLIALFVRRDFVAKYKQTILGPLWFIIQPLLTTLMFTVVFGKIAKIPTDGLPPMLFYLSGITAWNYFAESLKATSNTFVTNASIFGKVYFPRLAIPISVVVSNLILFVVQFLFLVVFMLIFYFSGASFSPNIFVLLLPVLLILMAGLGLGFGIIISSLTTKYRDLTYLVAFGIQLWMYATPIVYPLSELSGTFRKAALANPITIVVAFIAAPLTSLNPMLAAGWFAGLSEARIREPRVKDFESLSKIEGITGFWKNRVTRILLIVVFSNLGSTIGTFIALPYLASLL